MKKSPEPAAIMGDFANYRPVLTRKILQLVIEVPIEQAGEVFAALGYPTGGGSIPVAIARLEESAAQTQPRPETETHAVKEAEYDPPRHWPDMSPAQQTGVIRNETPFQMFAGAKDADGARDFIRQFCRVKSCADILPDTEAAVRWAQLQVRYGNWLRQRRGAA